MHHFMAEMLKNETPLPVPHLLRRFSSPSPDAEPSHFSFLSDAYEAMLCASTSAESLSVQAQCIFTHRTRKVCVSRWCVIILTDAGCQLDIDVSVCCEVSVGLVQGCEWHWQISPKTLYGTCFLSDDNMQFLQTTTQAHSLGTPALKSPQSVCLDSDRGVVQSSHVRSLTACDVLDLTEAQPWWHSSQSCPWVGSTHGLGWVASRFLAF